MKVVEDFTDDRDKLDQGHQEADHRRRQGFDITDTTDAASDTGAAFSADDSEFNIFNTDRQLSALETAAKMLGSLPEKKALVYFASGMTRDSNGNNQAQLTATVNAAIKANVSFYPIDARGLVASAPLGDATKAVVQQRQCPNGRRPAIGASELPGPAGNPHHPGRRYRRQSAARRERSLGRHRAGAEGYFQLLHHRL